jgi:hypothetical protein
MLLTQKLTTRIANHFLKIIETLYLGSISLIFRGFLSLYLMIIVFALVMAFCTWLILVGLFGFFTSLKSKQGGG